MGKTSTLQVNSRNKFSTKFLKSPQGLGLCPQQNISFSGLPPLSLLVLLFAIKVTKQIGSAYFYRITLSKRVKLEMSEKFFRFSQNTIITLKTSGTLRTDSSPNDAQKTP
jgi:hypothetical protein